MLVFFNEDQCNDFQIHIDTTTKWNFRGKSRLTNWHLDWCRPKSALVYDLAQETQEFNIKLKIDEIEVHSVTHNNPS